MEKITKGLARKMYNNGEEVMIVPNRVRPDSILAAWYTKPDDGCYETTDSAFDRLCTAIFYYNCNPETGMGLAFYAKEV